MNVPVGHVTNWSRGVPWRPLGDGARESARNTHGALNVSGRVVPATLVALKVREPVLQQALRIADGLR
jgi:hypothetical protein